MTGLSCMSQLSGALSFVSINVHFVTLVLSPTSVFLVSLRQMMLEIFNPVPQ